MYNEVIKMSKDEGVRLVKLNWDEECKRDFRNGKGFEIKESVVHRGEKTLHGIHSKFFCSDWSDDDAFAERLV